ncbi:hypothetical protein ACEQ8H_006561 [Pleosporales sp. CAS-2024a]
MHTSILVTGALAVLLEVTSAHGFVQGVTIDGVWTNGSEPLWYYFPANNRPKTAGWDALNQDIGFVEAAAMGTADVNCHKSAISSTLYANANAGDTIHFKWNTWPEGHNGPILNYISPCNGDCTTLPSTALRWTKISQSAILATSPLTWAPAALIQNNFTASTVLPKNLAPGNYVIRHEIIALHAAQNDNGAQLYPQCLNLKVSGAGTVAPTNGVAGTALYKRDDAGIKYNLYTGQTNYPFPGPAVWTAAN